MFGYIKPCQPELRVKELNAYKAVYCGQCGQLGRSFGPLARMTLSYDFTFLSMLHSAVNGGGQQVIERRCCVNPLSRKRPVCVGGASLEFSADIAALMLYYKLLDNIRDGGVLAKAGWSCLRPMASAARKQAAMRRPECEAIIAEGIARQTAVENELVSGLDEACEPSAAMLAGIFRQLSEQDSQQRILERMGYLIGRFIYVCDALDDLRQDVRRGGYNPLALRYNLTESGGDWEMARCNAKESLYLTIGETEKTLALLTLHDFVPIIENVVTLGLRASVEDILRRARHDTNNAKLTSPQSGAAESRKGA